MVGRNPSRNQTKSNQVCDAIIDANDRRHAEHVQVGMADQLTVEVDVAMDCRTEYINI